MVSTEKVNRLKSEIIAQLKQSKLLQKYAELYLHTLSNRTLLESDPAELVSFIQERFTFFQDSISKSYSFRIIKHPKPSKRSDHFQFELVCHDVGHLLITLEEIFGKLGLKVIRKFHPIMSVKCDKNGKIIDVQKPEENSFRVSMSYLEFIGTEDVEIIETLNATVERSLQALLVAGQARTAIHQKAKEVKSYIDDLDNELWRNQAEWSSLITWLQNHNFSFFGYTQLKHSPGEKTKPTVVAKEGLGILDKAYLKDAKLNYNAILQQHAWDLRENKNPFSFEDIHIKSILQRFEDFMCLSLKLPNDKGDVIEHVFLGLLRRSSLLAKNIETPLIHLKMKYVFAQKNMLPGTYDYNEVIRIFTSIPKSDLFRLTSDDLLHIVDDLLSINNPAEIYCFASRTKIRKQLFIMVAVPTALFTPDNIEKVKQYLKDLIGHREVDFVEAPGTITSRLHCYFDQDDSKVKLPEIEQVEQDIKNLIKPWDVQFFEALLGSYSVQDAKEMYSKYLDAFPPHHRLRRSPEETVRDVVYMEKLDHTQKGQFNLVPFNFSESVISGKASILFIYMKEKIDLIHSMPILQNIGIHVYDELTTRIGSPNNFMGYVHAFRVVDENLEKINETEIGPLIVELLEKYFEGVIDNDPLNALVVKGGLNWKQIKLLQMYRNFSLQVSTTFTREKINEALLDYPHVAERLVSYFEQKFDPTLSQSMDQRLKNYLVPSKQDFTSDLQHVSDVNDDLIFKRLFKLMESTLRTSYFVNKTAENAYFAIKVDSRKIDEMPKPVPFREIFVFDRWFEGTHLRFGKVARGGLRWSDRPDDFRSEILGLVKTQQTKNVVIVPEGAKGGFVIKRDLTERDALMQESETQYKRFIAALLEITDNVDGKGKTIHPEQCVLYDEEDPYLVVAADKGTAQFSDLANSISDGGDFWLGDAFASGGSEGYNHKEVGITAKGAWECVKLHFKEMGTDIQKEPFTVAGVGDMSGDVFGNGMLLSKQIKLVAAFNHMHIFLDPDPDPQQSWKERSRLFNLPRSTWEDYSTKLISKGGGVFNRRAKEVPLSEEIQTLLGVTDKSLSGEDLIRAILKMQVDLLWFGGIGTYIKDVSQSNLEVNDPANDYVRVNAQDCQVKVIGEGANLGVTQEARYAFSLAGGLVNTDFIDNSAGVNMSDYEVNIKILLKQLLKTGKLKSHQDRNKLLSKATDQVTELVLENNRAQHQLLSKEVIRSKDSVVSLVKQIERLVENQWIDPKAEVLIPSEQIREHFQQGLALPRPFLALILSYTKMELYESVIQAPYLDDPYLVDTYKGYFPDLVRKPYNATLEGHHLRREILGTLIVNHLINHAGLSALGEVSQLTGASLEQVSFAFLIIEEALSAADHRQAVMNAKLTQKEKYDCLVQFEDMVKILVTNLLQLPSLKLSFDLVKPLKDVVCGYVNDCNTPERKKLRSTNKSYTKLVKASRMLFQNLTSFSVVIDLFYLLQHSKVSVSQLLSVIDVLDELYHFTWLQVQVSTISSSSQWELTHREVISQGIRMQRLNLAQYICKHFKSSALDHLDKDQVLETLHKPFGEQFDIYFESIKQLKQSRDLSLSSLSVTVNRLNFVFSLH